MIFVPSSKRKTFNFSQIYFFILLLERPTHRRVLTAVEHSVEILIGILLVSNDLIDATHPWNQSLPILLLLLILLFRW